jgi:phosphatidylserine decarboxylase
MASSSHNPTQWLHPVHPDGRKFVVIAGVLTILLWWLLGTFAGCLGLALTAWVALFFRDPQRVVPQGDDLIISPADGRVCLIEEVVPPVQLGLGDAPLTRVSVFMNVFNVHINRTPISGTVSRIVYVPGKFLNADMDKASDDNERQNFVVTRSDGVQIGFVQIAGLVARRIIKFVSEGAAVQAGERVGLIRFGSRVDVYLPSGTKPLVCIGQSMIAGETVLARIGVGAVLTSVVQ